MGRTKFDSLRSHMRPEVQERARRKTEEMLAEMPLMELRRARHLTQEQLADLLQMSQPAVSKMEKQADMYLSTLRRMINAMGGELEINARFPDGAVRIAHLSGGEGEKVIRD